MPDEEGSSCGVYLLFREAMNTHASFSHSLRNLYCSAIYSYRNCSFNRGRFLRIGLLDTSLYPFRFLTPRIRYSCLGLQSVYKYPIFIEFLLSVFFVIFSLLVQFQMRREVSRGNH